MNKRGVSPVIATVLLVSLVIIIALAVFLWLRDVIPSTVLKFDKRIQFVCDEVGFDAEVNAGNLSIVNKRNAPIYDHEH